MEVNYYCTRSITDTNMIVNFSDYFVVEPSIVLTVSSGITNVVVSTIPEYMSSVGEVYSKVTLTFPPEYVGRKFSMIAIGE